MAKIKLCAEVTGRVWKIECPVGTAVAVDDVVVIVESMKMEIPVPASSAGRIVELLVAEGDPIEEGAVVAIIET